MKDSAAGEEIPVKNFEEVRTLLGPLDSNARLIREIHGVNVLMREGALRLLGKPDDVARVREVLEQGLDAIRRGRGTSTAEVARMIRGSSGAAGDDDLAAGGGSAGGTTGAASGVAVAGAGSATFAGGARADSRSFGGMRRNVQARTPNQHLYLEAMRDHDVVFAVGPAGTGKTYLAVAAAVDAVRQGQVRRIVLVRPAVEAGEKLGFLPGTLEAKVDPYLRPLYDALHDLLEPANRQRYLENEIVEVCPLAYMRGRTLNDAFIILDEAQNTTVPQMLMFLTRMGEGSRMVVTGDPTQVDLPPHVTSGLHDALARLDRVEGVAVVRLRTEDVVRHRVVQRILEAYGKDNA